MKTVIGMMTLLAFGAAAQAAEPTIGAGVDTTTKGNFEVVDANQDGMLDKREAKSSGIAEQKFKSMDSNGDEKVTRAEYLAAIRKEMQKGSMDSRDS